MSNTGSLPPADPPTGKPDTWRDNILKAGIKDLNIAMGIVAGIESYSRLGNLPALHEDVTDLQTHLWDIHKVLRYVLSGEKQ